MSSRNIFYNPATLEVEEKFYTLKGAEGEIGTKVNKTLGKEIDLKSSSVEDALNLKVNSVYQLVKGPPIKIDRNKLAVNNLITHPGIICKAEVLKSNLYDKYHNSM